MGNPLIPNEESVGIIEAWSDGVEGQDALEEFALSPLSSGGWIILRKSLALLLDAQRDAVLDEVVDRLNGVLLTGFRLTILLAIDDLRR